MAQRVRHDSLAWSPINISFNDFRGRPSLSADGSFASFSLGLSSCNDTVGGIVIPGFRANAIMHPYRSWMLPGSRTVTRLIYHSVQFDLVELARRRLQYDLNRGSEHPDLLLEEALCSLSQQFDIFDSVSDSGLDAAVVSQWEQVTSEMLDSLPAVEKRGSLLPGWLFELNFGLGYRAFKGELSEGFGAGFDLNVSFNYLWHRHMLSLDMGFGTVGLHDSVATTFGRFYLDVAASDVRMLAEYGFRIVDCNRWSITPFVGGGLHFIDQSEENDPFAVYAGTLVAGLLVQRHLSMTFTPMDGTVDRADFDLHAKLTVTHSTFNEVIGKPSGWGIYIDLGLGLGFGSYRCL